MKQDEIILHVKGESCFIDDLALNENSLHAAVFVSSIACGEIINIDFSEAEKIPGVISIITHSDIPGENEIGNVIRDEPLLAEKEIHFIGQPIAVVIAETAKIARTARKLIRVKYKESEGIFCPREAFEKNSLIAPPRTFSLGNTEEAWDDCEIIVSDRVESGAQEHLYLETQGAISIPQEDGRIKIISSTQSPTAVQRTVAWILSIPMHKIEVDVLRLGGGFGGKEDQATAWAAITAVAARKLNRPVKLVLKRQEDLRVTGKRHPYSSDFKIGLKNDGTILAYEVTFYQNAGAAADLSTAILERTLFHTTNSYNIPNVKSTAVSCKTNLPPNTAFRGFGGPQAMFVMECAIFKAAKELKIPAEKIQRLNLIKKDDLFPYGMKVKDNHAIDCWDKTVAEYNLEKIQSNVKNFNLENYYLKKGISLMPVCFGISFTSTFLNQASALIHVYTDGSVSISTGAIEMGQGVNEKIKTVVAKTFSISLNKIRIESTNTGRVANTSPTAASSGADMNGNAAKIASENILARLKKHAAELLKSGSTEGITIQNEIIYLNNSATELTWDKLVNSAYFSRINLSAHAHYATPEIFFDKKTEKGNAFAYHVVGTAITEVTVDCLRGIFKVDNVKIVHDFGISLNPKIDRGQVEGGLVQGIGWVTMEEILHDEKGRLLTDSLSTYKIPDISFAPDDIEIEFYQNPENSAGPFNSKAIGEPPFMYGIGTYFAIQNAISEYNPISKTTFSVPMQPEKILMTILDQTHV